MRAAGRAVHAVHHDGNGLRLRRSRHDHVRGTGPNMLLELFARREDPGALQHEVDTQLAPRQLGRVTLGERRDPVAVDDQLARRGAHVMVVAPVDAVVLEQVRQIVRVGDVVDCHEVEPIGIEQDLQRGPADPSQTVDGDGRHVTSPSLRRQLA